MATISLHTHCPECISLIEFTADSFSHEEYPDFYDSKGDLAVYSMECYSCNEIIDIKHFEDVFDLYKNKITEQYLEEQAQDMYDSINDNDLY